MMKTPIRALLAATLGLSLAGNAGAQTKGYMIGYFGSWNAWGGYNAGSIPWDHLTHINFSFLMPSASGHFNDFDGTEKPNLSSIVSTAKARGVKVLVSVGGSNGSSGFSQLAANAGARATLATNLLTYVNNNGLDGVDIDWEFPANATDSANYALLIKDLRAKFQGKLLTCAVAGDGEKGKWIPRSALQAFDIVNIMAFDFTGSFPGSQVGQHSSLTNARNGLQYWRARGATRDKCVIGIPLYGKNFNNGGQDIAYNDILAQNPGLSPTVDEVNRIFFNGPALVKAKATYVAEQSYGGCFFWQLGQDRSGNLVAQAKEGLKAPPTTLQPILTSKKGSHGPSLALTLTGAAILPPGLRDALGRVPSPSRGPSAAGLYILPSAPVAAPSGRAVR